MSFGITYIDQSKKEDGKGLNSVFYHRLSTDVFRDGSYTNYVRKVYSNKMDAIDSYFSEGADLQKISSYFRGLRDSEYQKECQFLQNKFGTSALSYDDDSVGSDIIEAFNTALNLEDVFKRNLALITDTNGQKGLITWFSTYFQRVWEQNESRICSGALNYIYDKAGMQAYVRQELYNLMKDSLVEQFSAGIENGIGYLSDSYQEAYRELALALQDTSKKAINNQFIADMWDSFHLDNFVNYVSKQMTAKQGAINFSQLDFQKFVGGNVHAYGGEAFEAFSAYVYNYISDTLNGKAVRSGQTLQKADTIISFGFDTSKVESWLSSNKFGTREQNVENMKELGKSLSNFRSDYIVFTNAKNYSLNSRFGGYSAGEKINLKSFENILKTAGIGKGEDFVFMIMQAIPGAIGDDISGFDESINYTFARAITTALFDDFYTIKESGSTRKTIHLLYLNGIYIPISFYYNLLYQAFQEAAVDSIDSTKSLVRFVYDTPDYIEFPTKASSDIFRNTAKKSTWAFQRKQAYNNIKIGYYFFSGFKKAMENLNISI